MGFCRIFFVGCGRKKSSALGKNRRIVQSAQRNLSKKPEVFPKFFWTKKGLPCYNIDQGNTEVFPVNPPSFIMNSILTSFAASSFLELVYFFVFRPFPVFQERGGCFLLLFSNRSFPLWEEAGQKSQKCNRIFISAFFPCGLNLKLIQ